ncbi:hypothetical protein ABBQ38_007095 [Trebouxia sp. C0009 RCD-2024]
MGLGSPESTINALSGGVAGAANIFTGFPFDTVKVRLQASPRGTYAGPVDCTRSILKFEGVRGLYRGLAAPLVGGALETGISYAVYTYTLGQLTAPGDLPSLSFAVPAAAGVAGVVLSFVLSPFELVKCRLQMGTRGTPHYHSGPRQCLQHLLKTEGSLGLTRGLKATIAREAPGNAIFFTVYETLRRSFPGKAAPDNPNPSLWELAKDSASAVGCGGLAGTIMWSAVLPLDVAKTRIQTAYPGSVNDIGIWQNLQLMYWQGGRRTLYAGLVPTLIRAFPANAAQWLAWELSRR